MGRTFQDRLAVREATPMLLGLCSPSGGGKTYSALRLATGMRKVYGGKIFHLDTEAGRALHYADQFEFQHVPFGPPYGASDYRAGIEHCVLAGAGVVIVDSFSHEHESTGGFLEFHDQEMQRLAEKWHISLDKTNPAAWINPKKERRKLIDYILHLPSMCFIFCFRAKEKTDWKKGEKPVPLGWVPVGGMDYVYELQACALFQPRADGVPTWKREELSGAQQVFVKLPSYFASILDSGKPLSEEMGEKMALWASGGKRLAAGWHAQQAAERATVAAASAPVAPVDYRQDIPPPCPKCGGRTIFKPAGRNKNGQWPDGWKCDSPSREKGKDFKNCKERGIRGAWVDGKEHHEREALRQAEAAKSALEEAKAAPEAPQREPGEDSPTDDLRL